MKIQQYSVYKKILPLGECIRNANAEWRARKSVVLRIVDVDGRVGQGEASPLPNYSGDTFQHVSEVLEQFPSSELDMPSDAQEGLRYVADVCRSIDVPSARFAMETALLDWLGDITQEPMHRLLRGLTHAELRVIPLAVLLDGENEDGFVENATALVRQGFKHFKIKISRNTMRERVLWMRRVSQLHSDIFFRPDANQSLSIEEVEPLLASLLGAPVEYFEEPLIENELHQLKKSAVPIALDESLQSSRFTAEWFSSHRAHVWVLKPMALGGIFRCLELAAMAQKHDIDVVVSHLFDGPIALAAASELALAIGGRRAAGLAPHSALKAWPSIYLPAFCGSMLVPHSKPGLGLEPLSL